MHWFHIFWFYSFNINSNICLPIRLSIIHRIVWTNTSDITQTSHSFDKDQTKDSSRSRWLTTSTTGRRTTRPAKTMATSEPFRLQMQPWTIRCRDILSHDLNLVRQARICPIIITLISPLSPRGHQLQAMDRVDTHLTKIWETLTEVAWEWALVSTAT